MDKDFQSRAAGISVIVPASNEAAQIGACLAALLSSRVSVDRCVEVIVVANGCVDDTASVARSYVAQAADRDWIVKVIERVEGGKPGALNAGDAAASGELRVYLDADVTVAPNMIEQLATVLDIDVPRYASGQVEIAAATPISRAYARIWRRVPFMRDVVPGCGLFAVNGTGRARWDEFPQIISDDIYARLQFRPDERVGVRSGYRWPIAEGWRNLIKVRRRQNAGVKEIAALYPDLARNDDKPDFPMAEKLRLAVNDPLGFLVYSGVALAVKMTPRRQQDWSRGR